MRIPCFFFLFVLVATNLSAQSVHDEIISDINLSAGNHLAYPGPKRQTLTPAPNGKRPFYISTYCRHGSRYLIGKDDYSWPLSELQRADSLGLLSVKGRKVMEIVRRQYQESLGRLGELTQLGAEQHQGIAARMCQRFPEVFEGEADIEAMSSTVIRCILSMENQMYSLLRHNPKLNIRHDASNHDMPWMVRGDKTFGSDLKDEDLVACHRFRDSTVTSLSFMDIIFSDPGTAGKEIDCQRLGRSLFSLATILQSSELGQTVSLYDLFTPEEAYCRWRANNAEWYSWYGSCPQTSLNRPLGQQKLLRQIISAADSCIALPGNRATMRFGHDSMVMPLVCLLELADFGIQVADYNDLDRQGWADYKIIPMAANVQLVFYRSSDTDTDVWVKPLLNENEVTLPLPPVHPTFYRWQEVRAYYLNKMDNPT